MLPNRPTVRDPMYRNVCVEITHGRPIELEQVMAEMNEAWEKRNR